jgi:hypothetical protein
MKTHKLISMDVEIAERLGKEENASALVERLLKGYFQFAVEEKKKSSEDEGTATNENQ